jgi:hypothetical protein
MPFLPKELVFAQQTDSAENTAPKQKVIPLDYKTHLSVLWTLSVRWKSNPECGRGIFLAYVTICMDSHVATL